MLSARSLFQEILDHDESYRLFCSIAAGGEAQGGWENGRIAALIPGSLREPAPKAARHGADEDKHGRLFHALLRKRGLDPVPVPGAADYTVLLEHPDIGRAVLMIAHDEENHLAYCHEELLRLAERGHGPAIRRTLRDAARVETEVYRDVSLAVPDRMGRILGRPRPKSALLAAGIRAVYVYERLAGWRRMVSLRLPERRDALGGPAAPVPGSG
ncbi:ferritin-like domain-containing protein [Streptomyces sp. Ac-502]|uniref:ferritin-like domain-containing protein n=1 Tax=Streptomyces sp. Ac-502 TaxID=3342801 RepID=UPI0038629D0E